MKNQSKIIIIGAGMAGLTAADQLQKKGHEVIVLEASNHIGGRIHTDFSFGLPFDQGAFLLHGKADNPLLPLIETLQLHLKLFPLNKRLVFKGNQTPMHLNDFQYLENHLEQLRANFLNEGKDASIYQVWQKSSPAIAITSPEVALNANGIGLYYGQSWDKVSADFYYHEDIAPDGNYLMMDGYQPLINYLAKDKTIFCNQMVKSIDYRESPIKVVTNDQTYFANKVIVTVSLGVLKNQTIKFFPELPKEKQQAIHQLQMGVLDKILLQFSESFWPKEIPLFNHLDYLDNICTFVNYDYFFNQPVLSAGIYGDYAIALEKLSDAAIIDQSLSILKKMFGNQLPPLINSKITRWHQSPHFLGSYSYPPVGTKAKHFADLEASIDGKLFFAGEATCPKYLGTVHGAYVSGLRVAEEI